MPSSPQTPTFKFLIDENVRVDLYRFLKQKGVDVKLAAKGASDETLSNLSKSEKRILVTNDEDFSECSEDEVYAVIWLRIPQNNGQALINSFEELVSEVKNFASKLIVLYENKWDKMPLIKEISTT